MKIVRLLNDERLLVLPFFGAANNKQRYSRRHMRALAICRWYDAIPGFVAAHLCNKDFGRVESIARGIESKKEFWRDLPKAMPAEIISRRNVQDLPTIPAE